MLQRLVKLIQNLISKFSAPKVNRILTDKNANSIELFANIAINFLDNFFS